MKVGENADAFYALHPELNDLESRIAAVSREALRRITEGECSAEEAAQDADQKIRSLREKHNEQIRSLGADPSDFEPHWACPLCQDTGYLRTPDGNRRMCSCLKSLAANLMLDSDDFRPTPEITFETFDLAVFPDEPDPVPGEKSSQAVLMQSALSAAKEYAAMFPPKNGANFILVGESGLGKTFLAQCIANEVQNKGFTVCSLTAFRLSSLMKDDYLGNEPAGSDELLLQSDLLVIDDLGSEPIRKNINIESLFSILNERSVARKPTIIVTNLMPVQLRDRYGERITSRLFTEGTIAIRLYGKDVRRLIKQ